MRFPNSVAQIGWNNPDSLYLSAHVRGDHDYVIRGNLAVFDFVSLNIYSGMLGYTPISEMRNTGGVTSEEIETDEAGNFELTLSAKPQPGNWLRLEPDANQLVIRRLQADWEETEEGDWVILNLTTLGQGSPRPTPERIEAQLRESVRRVRGVRSTLTMAHRMLFQLQLDPNEVPIPARSDKALPMSDPFQATVRAQFRLEEDEALLITVPRVPCRFTNIQLANPWMEAGDYASHQSSLNHRQAHTDEDGKIRYVVSRRDPGVPNWLDTAGYAEGSLFARWTHCDPYPEELTSAVVSLSELRTQLPASTPMVTAEQRAETIARRQAAFSRRMAGG